MSTGLQLQLAEVGQPLPAQQRADPDALAAVVVSSQTPLVGASPAVHEHPLEVAEQLIPFVRLPSPLVVLGSPTPTPSLLGVGRSTVRWLQATPAPPSATPTTMNQAR
jgi:hypothetical protein